MPKVTGVLAASITIMMPGKMTEDGRKMIADWIRGQAKHFEKEGDLYTKTGRFTARYIHDDQPVSERKVSRRA